MIMVQTSQMSGSETLNGERGGGGGWTFRQGTYSGGLFKLKNRQNVQLGAALNMKYLD